MYEKLRNYKNEQRWIKSAINLNKVNIYFSYNIQLNFEWPNIYAVLIFYII